MGRVGLAGFFTLVLTLVALLTAVGLADASHSANPPHMQGSSTVPRIPLYNSSSWAGYFNENFGGRVNGSATFVLASWVQPAMNCSSPKPAVALTAVGLDGMNSSTLEQVGSLGECIDHLASYSLFWQFYPSNSLQRIAGIKVSPGDTILANVSYSNATDKFTVNVRDGASTFTHTGKNPRALETSAECVVERSISSRGALSNLANFGSARFSYCYATINGYYHPIGSDNGFRAEVRMVSATSGKVIASVSSLVQGAGFSVTWKGYD